MTTGRSARLGTASTSYKKPKMTT
ncbi:TPA: hypothetical protein N0F65_004148 [Lagenidium giganteum]|uniref:Uncharacterized protein n=1 Tax=Lagenidium giganteum TaxID=4803 RepID=A0AAV2Z8L3_9STRA|nr:TPA: hypothetical protein N0F65_004148 [Lagenidium giganteum]